MSEYTEHRAICNYLKAQYPRVIFTSDGSGVRLSIGNATKLKNLKSGRGIPDLLIFEARGGYHGLLIEMKAFDQTIFKKNGLLLANPHLKEQGAMLSSLTVKGYKATFAIGFDDAKRVVDEYMELPIQK